MGEGEGVVAAFSTFRLKYINKTEKLLKANATRVALALQARAHKFRHGTHTHT